MTRKDLVRAVSQKLSVPEKQVEIILDEILEVIQVSLACGESVTIHKFGKFVYRAKQAVVRRNPRTGDQIKVPPKNSVSFQPSPLLKERINRRKNVL